MSSENDKKRLYSETSKNNYIFEDIQAVSKAVENNFEYLFFQK